MLNTEMNKKIWSDVILVPHAYVVTLACSEEEFEKASKDVVAKGAAVPEWLCEGAVAQVHEIEDAGGLMYLIVSLKTKPEMQGINIAAILAHEAVHCFQKIAKSLHEWDPSKEFEAYAIQMLTLELLTQYQKKLLNAVSKT